MGLRINTNIASIDAQKNLGVQQARNEHALAAMSSGSRIVRAADDAAGLSISEHIKGQLRGEKMARNNAYNAISLVQVGEATQRVIGRLTMSRTKNRTRGNSRPLAGHVRILSAKSMCANILA